MASESTIDRRRLLARCAGTLGWACALGTLTGCAEDNDQPARRTAGAETSPMPARVLGKTGLRVSTLSFGGGSQFLENDDGTWEPLLEEAIQLGVNLFDTSSGYRWSASLSSEERFGKVLAPHRKRLLLSTKLDSRDPDQAKRHFERSLRRLRTDYVDILMIHSIEADEDLSALEKGVYKLASDLKGQGAARFIGFSSMNSAAKSRAIIETFELDVCLLALNPTRYGDFATVALPAARKKNLGILAMKVMRNIVDTGKATPKQLLQYALDQPAVASAVVGHVGLRTLEHNARLVREMARPTGRSAQPDNAALELRLAPYAGARHLCWARPEYTDSDPAPS